MLWMAPFKMSYLVPYKKTPTIQVPATPDYMNISPFLSQSAQSSANFGVSPPVQSSPEGLLSSSSSTSLSPLGSPSSNTSAFSSQPRLIRAPQDKTQKREEFRASVRVSLQYENAETLTLYTFFNCSLDFAKLRLINHRLPAF